MAETKFYPYFNISDVETMYFMLKGSRKGITSFITKAKSLASRSPKGGSYIFKDEEALFELFKSELPFEIESRRFKDFGDLVQMIS